MISKKKYYQLVENSFFFIEGKDRVNFLQGLTSNDIYKVSENQISYSAILQQSTSVHLMGYSYLFSIIFALGIMSIILNILENKYLNLTKIVLVFPLITGILLLCIRVSMLTGVNG